MDYVISLVHECFNVCVASFGWLSVSSSGLDTSCGRWLTGALCVEGRRPTRISLPGFSACLLLAVGHRPLRFPTLIAPRILFLSDQILMCVTKHLLFPGQEERRADSLKLRRARVSWSKQLEWRLTTLIQRTDQGREQNTPSGKTRGRKCWKESCVARLGVRGEGRRWGRENFLGDRWWRGKDRDLDLYYCGLCTLLWFFWEPPTP